MLTAEWVEAMEAEVSPGTAELFDLYASAHWVPFFRHTEALTERGIADYRRHRLRKVTRSTLAKELSALRRFFAWLRERGFEAPDVPKLPPRQTGTPAQPRELVVLTPDEVVALLAALPERTHKGYPARAFFTVLWETGLRRSTIQRLRSPEHYHRGSAELRLTPAIDKARYGRVLPLTEGARAALDSQVPAKPGLIFGAVDYRATLKDVAKKVIGPRRAKRLGYHAFRHARTTQLLESGGSLVGVAYLVGHRQVTTTNAYVHARRQAADDALNLSGREVVAKPEEKVSKRSRKKVS